MAYGNRRRRFGYGGGGGRSAVYQKQEVQKKRRSKCKGCGLPIEVGDAIVKLKLRRQFRHPCGTCSHKPVGSKRFHAACVPSDLNAAMGYDPNAQQQTRHFCRSCGYSQSIAFGAFCPTCGKDPNKAPAHAGGGVAPPPKPKDAKELTLEAIMKLEESLIARIRQGQKLMPGHSALCADDPKTGRKGTPCDTCAEFKKFQGIKARILRPSTDGEEHAAMVVGLQRLVKLVLS